MKRILVLLVVVFASFSANAILVDAANDAASKELGASVSFLGYGSGWDVEGGNRYHAGSCMLVYNDP